MSCDPFEWTCARCGKTYSNPFFISYPREFWKDNKKRVGEVCEECRDEVDNSSVRRRKAAAADEVGTSAQHLGSRLRSGPCKVKGRAVAFAEDRA